MREFSSDTKSEFLDIIRDYYNGITSISKVTSLEEMADFCSMHQLSALLYNMLLSPNTKVDINKQAVMTSYLRHAQVNMAIAKASNDFAQYLREHNVPFSFIKGQFIKDFYHPSEIRSMGDADIYIPSEYFDVAREYLTGKGFSTSEYYASVTTYKKDFVEFEVHSEIDWFGVDWSTRATMTASGYDMESEVMLTIVHALKHIVGFGCGARQVLDVALLLRQNSNIITNSTFKSWLSELNIFKCYSALIGVINRWFGTNYAVEIEDNAVDILEESILDGGVFGKNINDYSTVNKVRNKSKISMYWGMLFPKYERMVLSYPKLREKKYLLPWYYIKRLFTRGIKEKRYKLIEASGGGDNSTNRRKQFVEMLEIEDQYYNKV